MEDVHPFNGLVCHFVFPYLNHKDLLSASRVCKTWKEMSTDKYLWKTIKLDKCRVVGWHKLVDLINEKETVRLDTKNMLTPKTNCSHFHYWKHFNNAIVNAKTLKSLYLYRCPPHVVEKVISSLPELEVFGALLMKNSICMDNQSNAENMSLNLNDVSQLTKLTELKINGLSKIVFDPLPTFTNLKNLKTLSLTSKQSIFNGVWRCLYSVNTSLTHLEIGDCNSISEEFPIYLQKFINLTFLRLESYTYASDTNKHIIVEVFNVISKLPNLKCLELENIVHTVIIESNLDKCANLKKLAITPSFSNDPAFVNHCLIKFLKQFSNTLTNVKISLPTVFDTAGYFIFNYVNSKDLHNCMPIQNRTMKILKGSEDNNASGIDNTEKVVNKLSVPDLEISLNEMMQNTKISLCAIPPKL